MKKPPSIEEQVERAAAEVREAAKNCVCFYCKKRVDTVQQMFTYLAVHGPDDNPCKGSGIKLVENMRLHEERSG
jgi:hypothetical protein